MPIIIMVIINTFDLPEIKLGIFTIPRLISNRYEELCPIFSKEFLSNSIRNFKEGITIVLLQNDKMVWNAFPIFGVFYIFSIPFTVMGITYTLFKGKKAEYKTINIWFIASLLTLFAVEPNMVRINIIWIPLIIYTIIGINVFSNKKEQLLNIFIIIYVISFIFFEHKYINTKFSYPAFIDDAKEIVKYLDKKEKEVYMEYTFKEPYIYFMFYNKMNPNSSKELFDEKGIFANVKTIGNYHFYIPNIIDNNEIYVVNENSDLNNVFKDFNEKKIGKYVIYEK